jgi:hypothetical protein
VIAWALKNDVIEIEATPEAEDAWVREVIDRSAASADRAKACTPGYYNREGQANAKTRQGSFFFGSPTEYADILQAWRAEGSLPGFEILLGASSPGVLYATQCGGARMKSMLFILVAQLHAGGTQTVAAYPSLEQCRDALKVATTNVAADYTCAATPMVGKCSQKDSRYLMARE